MARPRITNRTLSPAAAAALRLRGILALSQNELSDATGIPQGRIANFETGARSPNFEELEALEMLADASAAHPLLGNQKDNLKTLKREFHRFKMVFEDPLYYVRLFPDLAARAAMHANKLQSQAALRDTSDPLVTEANSAATLLWEIAEEFANYDGDRDQGGIYEGKESR